MAKLQHAQGMVVVVPVQSAGPGKASFAMPPWWPPGIVKIVGLKNGLGETVLGPEDQFTFLLR